MGELLLESDSTRKEELISEIAGVIDFAAEEQAKRLEGKQSFAYSLSLRIVGMLFGGALAIHFGTHYPGDSKWLSNVIVSNRLELFAFVASLILLPLMVYKLIHGLIKAAKQDRRLPLDAVLSNTYKVFLKPIFIYSVWTYVLYLVPSISETWLVYVVAGFIFSSTEEMNFRDQRLSKRCWRGLTSGT